MEKKMEKLMHAKIVGSLRPFTVGSNAGGGCGVVVEHDDGGGTRFLPHLFSVRVDGGAILTALSLRDVADHLNEAYMASHAALHPQS